MFRSEATASGCSDARTDERRGAMMGQRLLLMIGVFMLAVGGCATDDDGSTSPSAESQPAESSQPTVTDTRDRPPVLTLATVADSEPMRVSTVIGDLEFTSLEIPPDQDLLIDVLATPHGLVAGTSGSLRWSTDGGLTWEGITAPGTVRDLSRVHDDVVALDDEGAGRYSWNGTEWSEVGRLDLDDVTNASTNTVSQLVFGPTGAVAIARDATISSSADGMHFAAAEPGLDKSLVEAPDAVGCGSERLARPNYEPTVPILATDAGYVALTPADPTDWGLSPTCEPVLWTSADGSAWELVSQDLPFGPGAFVTMIGERSGRFVAIGGRTEAQQTVDQGAVWVSDDGLSWQQVEFDALRTVSIAGGELGWMLTGWSEAGLPGESMWFSTDGVSWDGPFDVPGGLETSWVTSQPVIGSDLIFGTSDNAAVIARPQP
jgi:hypothetical protein